MYKTAIAILALTLTAGCRDAEGESTILRVPKDFPTIRAALYFAQRGHTIEVSENKGGVDGYYTEVTGEYFPLEVRDGITIRRSTSKVTIDMDSAYSAPLFRVIGNDVTIEGFTFHSITGRATAAINARGVHNLKIRNCDFRMQSSAGISIEGCRNVTIEENTFYPWLAVEEKVIPHTAAVAIRDSIDVAVRHNTVSGFHPNILCERSTAIAIEWNIIIDGNIGIMLDRATLSTASIARNDVWRNATNYVNVTTHTAFAPEEGDNISADPRFVDREGIYNTFDFHVHESSPVVLASGIMGARPAVRYAARPTIAKSSNTAQVLLAGQIAEVLRVTMTNEGNEAIHFISGIRLWAEVASAKPISALKVFEIATFGPGATGWFLVAEGAVEQGAARLLLNQSFPQKLIPGETREFLFTADTTDFTSGDSIQITILSMEWFMENGALVNDGFTPFGLPITHTVVKP